MDKHEVTVPFELTPLSLADNGAPLMGKSRPSRAPWRPLLLISGYAAVRVEEAI